MTTQQQTDLTSFQKANLRSYKSMCKLYMEECSSDDKILFTVKKYLRISGFKNCEITQKHIDGVLRHKKDLEKELIQKEERLKKLNIPFERGWYSM